MNREIKFRAWHCGEGNMYRNIAVLACPNYLFRVYEDYSHREYIGNDKHLTIMQFTGLKDKNGVEIYEGDIVKVYQHYIGDISCPEQLATVEFEEAEFYLENLKGKPKWLEHNLSHHTNNSTCEVIGNIYENPDLVKELV